MSSLNLNMNTKSNFNLSLLVNMGASRWYYKDEKIANNFLNEDFKNEVPKNEIFEISSMIFNIIKHKKEILNKYKCYYDEKSNGLFLILNNSICFSEFSKEIMLNLFDFSQKVGIKTISFLVSKKNPQFIRIMQDLMIVGFKINEKMKKIMIEDDYYKVMEMPVKVDETIEEFFF